MNFILLMHINYKSKASSNDKDDTSVFTTVDE